MTEAGPVLETESEISNLPPPPPATFEELGVGSEVSLALTEMGFLGPMPVQSAVYRPMVEKRDILVQSRTGSGKTAAFGIPLCDKLLDESQPVVQALCLVPTRELALQVATECKKIGKHRNFQVSAIYGGAPMGRQIDELKAGAHIVAGTPGRVLDHLRRGTLNLQNVRALVLDEADEMLSMGFIEDILAIIERCPKDRQTVLFSATLPDDVVRIASRHMREPERIQLSQGYVSVHDIAHHYYMVSGMGRARDLVRLLDHEKPQGAIIFCNTREDTALVAEYLRKAGYRAEAISSDLTQKERERVMGEMKQKTLPFLVATDIAARGIDISDLGHVINYTFPESPEVYVHRTGRTGRAGKSGVAISLIGPRELGSFYMLKLTYKIKPEEKTLPPDSRKSSPLTETTTAETNGTSNDSTAAATSDAPVQLTAEGHHPLEKIAPKKPSAPPPALIDRLIESADRHETRPEYIEVVEQILAREDGKQILARLVSGGGLGEPRPPRDDRGGRPGGRDARGGRDDRGGRGGRDDRGGRGGRDDRGPSARGGRDDRGPRSGRDDRGPRPGRTDDKPKAHSDRAPIGGTIENTQGKEFWEAWVDNKDGAQQQQQQAAAGGGEGAPRERGPRPDRGPRPERAPLPELPAGQVRLYLNLGQRTKSSEEDIRGLFSQHSITPIALDMRPHHTFVIVDEAQSQPAQAALAGQSWNGRPLRCEVAKA